VLRNWEDFNKKCLEIPALTLIIIVGRLDLDEKGHLTPSFFILGQLSSFDFV